jgi:hypothetical protein
LSAESIISELEQYTQLYQQFPVSSPTKNVLETRALQQLKAIISEPRTWNTNFGKTVRRNGEIVEGQYRNILDRGKWSVEGSGGTDSLIAGLNLRWVGNELWAYYDAPHSGAVIDGFITKSGKLIKGRKPAQRINYALLLDKLDLLFKGVT